jgi:hypothetical protein
MESKTNEVTSKGIDSLFDSDLLEVPVSISSDQTTTNGYPKSLPREVYKSLREAWNETYGEDSKPPTSDQIKKLYHTWITYPFDEDGWHDKYVDYYEGFCRSNVIENQVAEEQDELVSWYFRNAWEISYTPFIQFVSKFVFDGQLLNITDINPFLLTSLKIQNKDDLPEEAGIYFVIDASKVYYIGMSRNLQERWYCHHRQADFDKLSNLSIAYIGGLPTSYLRSIETTLIHHFTPKLNIQNNPLLNNRI